MLTSPDPEVPRCVVQLPVAFWKFLSGKLKSFGLPCSRISTGLSITTAASSLPPCGRAPKFSLHALDFGNKPFELVLWSASALRSTFSRRNYDTVRLIIMWREFSTLKDCLDKKFNNLGIKWTKLKMQIIQRNLSMQEARLKADKL